MWFLSAVSDTGKMAHKALDGSPFYQRNVIYYLVVPAGHTSCSGLNGPNGLDDACPHKLLIRKVVDVPPATSPTDNPDLTEESLIRDVTPYLTRPNGRDLSAMQSEPNLERAEVVASNLLWFEVTLNPDPEIANEVQLDLRAVSLDDARREVQFGSVSLAVSRFTQQQLITVVPKN